MATAYAAFTSLMHLITQLQKHPYPPIRLDEKQFDTLSSNISFFQRFLEDHHGTIDHELEMRIADSAHAVEDLIETHIADRVPDFYGCLQKAIECLDLIKKEVMMEMNQKEQSRGGNNQPTRYPTPLASSQPPLVALGESLVVGIEDITINIIDKLTASQHKSDRRIISISGMGGIGKTTLAQKVYDHPYIKNYFDFFAWAIISKDYNIHESLVELVHCLDRTGIKEILRAKDEHNLGEQLYKYLIGRRYLVILDDVWDLEAWDRLRSFFPTYSGSGIVITTRESKFASISSNSFRMDLLDEHKSWDLFCKHVFGQDCCPSELKNVGKKIAKNCRGLPLSIAVIGSHLAKSPRTIEYWENIAQNLSSVVNSVDNGHCLKILSLSYTHLPVHLKPCFLYMAIFPEDQEISVSRLARLWVAEGFVKPINGKSLEKAAKDYLNDLVGRNLILAYASSDEGRVKRCKIHDLLRDFCIKEASKKNFLCSVQKQDDMGVLSNERRIAVHPSALKEASEKQDLLDSIGTQNKEPSKIIGPSEPMINDHHLDISIVLKARVLLRSLIFYGALPSLENKLLRVLHLFDGPLTIDRIPLLQDLNRLVNLRYLQFWFSNYYPFHCLPSPIFLQWNLQYLIIERSVRTKAPPEIWKMSQLRYIKIWQLILPHPPSESDNVIMENLQSAQRLVNFNICEEVVNKIPNIKTLAVYCDADAEGLGEGLCSLNNVDRLQKLESFVCDISYKVNVEQSYYMLRNVTFPHSLKKLSFSKLHWDDVTTKIGSLPLLEVLLLHQCTRFEWKLVEGQFVKLKFLSLYKCRSLRHFTANNNHFPCLESLVLSDLFSLEGISSEIGDIPTLKSIELRYDCPDSAVISAKEIAVEQYDLGNEQLQVTARLYVESDLSESLSTCNFIITKL